MQITEESYRYSESCVYLLMYRSNEAYEKPLDTMIDISSETLEVDVDDNDAYCDALDDLIFGEE